MPLDQDLQDIFKLLKEFSTKTSIPLQPQPQQTTNKYQAPLKGQWYNSGGFDPTGKGSVGRVHQGIDFRQAGGSPVYSIAPGTIKNVYSDPKGGNAVVISHDNNVSSYYAHLGGVNVQIGDKIDYNTVIGTVGASGNAKGFPHCHIQAWRGTALIDPGSLIPVPPYQAFNPKKEKLWVSDEAKEKADKFNLSAHLAQKQNKKVV